MKSRSKGLGSGRVQRTVPDEARPHRVRGQNLCRPDENGSAKRERDQLPRKGSEAQDIRSHTRPRKQRTTTHSARQARAIHGSLAHGLVRVYKAQSEVLEKAAQRGAKVKVVAPVNQTNASVARELAEVIEVRNVTVPIMHFASADSAEIIFLEDIPDDTNVNAGQDVATWTNDPLLVKSHEKIFETIWSTLQPKEGMKAKAR